MIQLLQGPVNVLLPSLQVPRLLQAQSWVSLGDEVTDTRVWRAPIGIYLSEDGYQKEHMYIVQQVQVLIRVADYFFHYFGSGSSSGSSSSPVLPLKKY